MPKFTDRFLAALTVENGRKDRLVFDTVCPGLGVRVTIRGTRSFVAQWTDPATRRKVREPIGVWGNLTIERARDAVRARLGAVAKGIDPKAERRRRRFEAERERTETALTFDALIKEWKALHLAHRRPRNAAEAECAIRRGLPGLLKRPGARMKNGKPHTVHLSEAAQAVLRSIPRFERCDLIFTTTSYRLTAGENSKPKSNRKREPAPISGFSQGKRYLDAAITTARAEAATKLGQRPAPIAAWRVHDLRRTGVTTLARLGFDSIVVDKLLAHQPTKLRGVAGVYQRHDFAARERAQALDAWAAHVTGTEPDNVVCLRAG